MFLHFFGDLLLCLAVGPFDLLRWGVQKVRDGEVLASGEVLLLDGGDFDLED